MIKYALHPGTIISSYDDQFHHVTALQLAKLHNVNMSECIVVREGDKTGVKNDDLIHLYPQWEYANHTRGIGD